MKPHHRPLANHPVVASLSVFLHFVAFLLLLLVALSLPIIKPVFLVTVKSLASGQPSTNLATELRFGVWGVCATSVFNQPTLLTNNGECFGPQLGYEIPDTLLEDANISPDLAQAVLKGLLVVLVLHPISAGFTLLGLISSLFIGTQGLAILSLVISIITGILCSVVLAIDLALVVVTRDKVNERFGGTLDVGFGNGVWMALASVICTWLAVIVLSARTCYCCGVRKHVHNDHHHDHY